MKYQSSFAKILLHHTACLDICKHVLDHGYMVILSLYISLYRCADFLTVLSSLFLSDLFSYCNMFSILKLLAWMGLSPIPYIAKLAGTGEPALNLLISIILSYPLAIVYHNYIRKKRQFRNIFFILSGLDMAFFNFGLAVYHNAIPVLVLYLTTLYLGPSKENCLLTIIFNMSYLIIGYICTESENYDITWTMPQCVLTLKLIALAFDLWDGDKLKQNKELSENQKKSALLELPSLLELFGFVYFAPSFLVGPIFSFKRYKDFITDKYPLDDVLITVNRHEQSRTALILGFLYLAAYQIGGSFFNVDYMLSEEFLDCSIIYRHIYCGLWAHVALYKYISCWLFTEGACTLFGLSYNGCMENQKKEIVHKWDGCQNIKVAAFEKATRFQDYVVSFNCNTNYFASEYVYKRLKFLGNRTASQTLTLLFLALWHGMNSGYYVTFMNEFLIIDMEKDFESIIKNTKCYNRLWSGKLKYILFILLKSYTLIFMGWSLIPFDVKVASKWTQIYSSLWFSGYIIFVPWNFLYKPLFIKFITKYDMWKS